MKRTKKGPRILIITPEITHLPSGTGNMANHLTAKGGGLADVSATLVSTLFEKNVDVHVALPHYRKIFHVNIGNFLNEELLIYKTKLPEDRIHLAEDRAFYYLNQVYNPYENTNNNVAMVFQRELINNIIPTVRPDLIHCNDWTTGLIPGFARRLNIPCLFTVHNIHTLKLMMSQIEQYGIDVEEFWQNLYHQHMPHNYHESRTNNPVDLLCSGIFAAHFINTVSRTFLTEIIDGRHEFVNDYLRNEFSHKVAAGCATGVLNSPDSSYDPEIDKALATNYSTIGHKKGKQVNKLKLQKSLNLERDEDAPLLFWPSRLDPNQKGCQLLAEIFYQVIDEYWHQNLQIVMVANGSYQKHFHDILNHHHLFNRAAVCDFDESLSRMGYAASDFMIMPSLFEPCGLPQMICQIYGSLPVARDIGGIHDTVSMLNSDKNTGNGFLFEAYDSNGLKWAIDQAMEFYNLPDEVKNKQISRIMSESKQTFNYKVTALHYMEIYDKMLTRPLVN